MAALGTHPMLNSFVLCCNFCVCKCACTVVVRSPRGGGVCHLVTVPQGVVGDRLPWVRNGNRGGGGGGYHRSTGRGCWPLLLALIKKVGAAYLFGTNWEVKRSCTCMPQRSGWGLPLQLLLHQAVLKAPRPPQLPHDEASMDTLVEPCKPGADVESPQPPQLENQPPRDEANGTLGPVTSIRLKIKNPWYTSKSCKVEKLGPWDL